DGDRRREVGEELHDARSRDELREVEPVRADVADGPEFAALLGLEPPVPVGREQQPVLEVTAVDVPDLAYAAVAHERAGLLSLRIEPDVEVRAVHEPAAPRQVD